MACCIEELTLNLTQFADDSTMTYSSKDLEKAIETTKAELNRILKWLAANKLIINLDKTELMLFTNKNRPESISINVRDHTIKEVTETKFLGVIIDNKLCWKAHINYISKKISKSISLLKMLKYTFPSRILKSMYYSFVYPYFTYCNLIWGGAAKTHLESLILLQKKCVRIINKVGYYDSTKPLFIELNLLTVEQIYEFNCAKFIFCSFNNIKYAEFSNRLVTNNSLHNYQTRSAKQFRKEYTRLQKFMNSFLNKGIEMWNSLPEYIKNVKALQTFKKKTKDYIIGKCKFCNLKEIGNEYHYLLICPAFNISRMEHIKKYYYNQPNTNKLTQLLNIQDCSEILHLERFKEIIYKQVKSQ